MGLVKFLGTVVVGIAAATAVVSTLPVLGAAGAAVAAAVGTGATVVNHIKYSK